MNTITAPLSSTTKWLITLTVMMVAVMEVLDMTIVNVAMRDMMGTFGSTISEITWVVTAYVVAAAIVMPLTGFLVGNLGQKRILLINIIGFMIASALCGLSTSLGEMIIFRALQGVFGASLIPLSQFILRATFPKKELGKAMAVWGMGILVGPILGPTLGGYITEHMSWHWIFFINVPVCLIAITLTVSLISETPRSRNRIDYLGITLLAMGVGSFQTLIEEGYRYDWFSSQLMLALAFISFAAIGAFIIRGINNVHNVVDLSIFKNQQFVTCSLILMLYSLALFGTLVMQPLMTETLFNYSPSLTGLLMAPRGIVALLCMPLVPLLMKRISAKPIIFMGICLTAFGTFLMTRWNLQTDFTTMAYSGMVQGMGMAMVFGPTSTIVFETLPARQIASGTGMFSFGRSIGLSIGVAMLSTILTQQMQVNWSQLGEHLTFFNNNLLRWFSAQQLPLHSPLAAQQVANLLYQQASMIAYLDVFTLSAACFALLIPVVFLIPKGRVNLTHATGAH